MELRLSEDETKEGSNEMSSGGLKLAGGNANNNLSENTNENPWDFNREVQTMESPSISRPIVYDTSSVSADKGDSKIVTISMYICYAFLAIQIVSMIWIATQPSIDLYNNLLKMQGFYVLTSLVVLVDVIIVQVFYEKKISLILVWLFVPVFYPWRRGKHVQEGETLGTLCTVFQMLVSVALVGFIVTAFKQYGLAISADDMTRQELVMLMDQVDENGNRYGDMITENVKVLAAGYEKVDGMDAIGIEGVGTITFESDALVDHMSYSVTTRLAFVKENDGTYKIKAVELGDTLLNEHGSKMYWNTVMKQ